MELDLQGRWAIVAASSQGLGFGCAQALVAEGANVVLNGRDAARLAQAAQSLRARAPASVEVREVAADATTAEGRAALLAACAAPDIVVTNAGGPPAGDFRDWDEAAWLAALRANMLAPIALMKAVVDGMAERGFGRIVNITSGAVKAPIDTLGLSNGARAGLTGFVAGVARQPRLAARGVTINNLLPGAFDTERLRGMHRAAAQREGVDPDVVAARRRDAVPARRFGDAAEFGAWCAFLCSRHGGYVTGQNILIDGGAYPGTF